MEPGLSNISEVQTTPKNHVSLSSFLPLQSSQLNKVNILAIATPCFYPWLIPLLFQNGIYANSESVEVRHG